MLNTHFVSAIDNFLCNKKLAFNFNRERLDILSFNT